MTPLELRNQIESLLSSNNLLGIYTYAGGATAPACWIDWGTSEGKPNGVVGLECVLRPYTAQDFTPMLAGDYVCEIEVEVTLKQWNLAATTIAATDELKRLDALAEIRPRQPRLNALDTIEQQVLIFRI